MTAPHFELKIDDTLSLVLPPLQAASEIFNLIDADKDHLRTWLPWVDSVTIPADTCKNLADRIEDFQTKKQAAFYGTVDGEYAASVGFISLIDGVGEIGYWLFSYHSGRGLMTTFVKKCIEYGFEELNLNQIVIKCAEGNVKSAAIPQRLGFTQCNETEPARIRNGTDHNTLVFTLDRNQWST